MSKGIASMEQKQCSVTGKIWDTGSLLVAKNTKAELDMYTVTGYAFSPEVQEQLDKGFVAIIEIDEEATMSKLPKGKQPKMLDAVRTGRLCYLKKEVADELFNLEVQEMNFASEDVFEMLNKQYEKSKENVDTTEEKKTTGDDKS